MENYVGITGATSVSTALKTSQIFSINEYNLESKYLPLIGLNVGQPDLKEFPLSEGYSSVDKLLLTLTSIKDAAKTAICYYTTGLDDLPKQIDSLFADKGLERLCDNLQLCLPSWPGISQMSEIKFKHQQVKHILRVTSNMVGENTPLEVAKRIELYTKNVDGVLLCLPANVEGDRSQYIAHLGERYNAIKERAPRLNIGFFGRFGELSALELIEGIKGEIGTGDFSICAEKEEERAASDFIQRIAKVLEP